MIYYTAASVCTLELTKMVTYDALCRFEGWVTGQCWNWLASIIAVKCDHVEHLNTVRDTTTVYCGDRGWSFVKLFWSYGPHKACTFYFFTCRSVLYVISLQWPTTRWTRFCWHLAWPVSSPALWRHTRWSRTKNSAHGELGMSLMLTSWMWNLILDSYTLVVASKMIFCGLFYFFYFIFWPLILSSRGLKY